MLIEKGIQMTSEINRKTLSHREHACLSLHFFFPLSKHFSSRVMNGVKTCELSRVDKVGGRPSSSHSATLFAHVVFSVNTST